MCNSEIQLASSNLQTFISIGAVIISLISIILATIALLVQRIHNHKSIKPIGKIKLGDYEDSIFVKIANCGIGPLIIKSISLADGNDIKDNLIDFFNIPELKGLEWNDFVREIPNRAIRVDEDLILIKINDLDKPPTKDHALQYKKAKTRIRSILSNITITLTYTDVYGKKNYVETRKLSWFGR